MQKKVFRAESTVENERSIETLTEKKEHGIISIAKSNDINAQTGLTLHRNFKGNQKSRNSSTPFTVYSNTFRLVCTLHGKSCAKVNS